MFHAHAITLEGGLGFGSHIEQLGREGLHAKAEFQIADDRFELGIVRALRGVVAVERLNEIELTPLVRWGKMLAADVRNGGLGKILAIDADGRAFVNGRQKRRRIDGRLGGAQADHAGQILILRAEAVSDPGAHARATAEPFACVQLQEGLRMVAGVRVHAVDHAKFVRVLGGLGQQFGNPEAAVAVSLEIKYRTRMRRLRDLRFIVESVQMRWAAGHAQEDHALGAGGQWRGLGRERIGGVPVCGIRQ